MRLNNYMLYSEIFRIKLTSNRGQNGGRRGGPLTKKTKDIFRFSQQHDILLTKSGKNNKKEHKWTKKIKIDKGRDLFLLSRTSCSK